MLERKTLQRTVKKVFSIAILATSAVTPKGANANPYGDVEHLAKQYCTALSDDVRVLPIDRIHRIYQVTIPQRLGARSIRVFSVAKDNIIRIVLRSPYSGAVGIHGLSDIVPIIPGQDVQLTFRAAYKGRFPVHFHGINGIHAEVAIFLVQ